MITITISEIFDKISVKIILKFISNSFNNCLELSVHSGPPLLVINIIYCCIRSPKWNNLWYKVLYWYRNENNLLKFNIYIKALLTYVQPEPMTMILLAVCHVYLLLFGAVAGSLPWRQTHGRLCKTGSAQWVSDSKR